MNSIVIGSGFGGIAAAIRLRAKGYNVTLCPFALSLIAAAIPPKPEPITIEFIKFNFILFLRKVTKLSII